MNITLDQIMSSPDFYPIRINVRTHLVSFVYMPRDYYRESSFLDHRAISPSDAVYTANLDDLLLYSLQVPADASRVHYILHGAFCCSTLLARYLELLPSCFVLKEPSALTQVSSLMPDLFFGCPPDRIPENADFEDWLQLFTLCVRLLSRRYSAQEVVIIKVNDICNVLGSTLLCRAPESRILFLYSPLKTFLMSVLKAQNRRPWIHARAAFAKKHSAPYPELARVDVASLDDAQAAAYVWLFNDALSRSLQIGNSDRVSALNGEQIAELPSESLKAVTHLFNLPLAERELKLLLADPSIARYSKNPAQQYNAEVRRQMLADATKKFSAEAERGLEFALSIKDELPLPLHAEMMTKD